MMKTSLIWPFQKTGMAYLVLTVLAVAANASERLTTGEIDVVQKKAIQLGDQHGASNVLLVFDLDNTLLASDRTLGSDQWFDWQAGLLEKPVKCRRSVVPDFEGLLSAQSILYALGSMHPPEAKSPSVVRGLQARGFHAIVLTARGPQHRDSTKRHLDEGGYSFTVSEPPVVPGFRGRFMPYLLKDVPASGLSRQESERFRLGVPREVSYDQGVFMTAGQHKGAMLLVFLAHCPRHFSAVIFVDDKERNTADVFWALEKRGIEVFAYRYSAEDEEVAAFSTEEKQKTVSQWQKLSGVINDIFN